MESNEHRMLPAFKVRDKACSDNKDNFNEECLWFSVVKDHL